MTRRGPLLVILGLVVAGSVGVVAWKHNETKTREARTRDAQARFATWTDRAARAQAATDSFFRCVVGASTKPVRDAKRFRKALAQQNRGGYEKLGQRVRASCSPPVVTTLKELEGVASVPTELANAWPSYLESLRALVASVETYADGAAKHGDEDRSHAEVVSVAERWSKTTDSPDKSRIERFLACAVPGLATAKNKEAAMVWINAECVSANASAYMQHVLEKCTPDLDASDAGEAPTSPDMVAALARFHGEQIAGMGIVPMMLAACTEAVRKEWVDADAEPAIQAASGMFAEKRSLESALQGLAPPPPISE